MTIISDITSVCTMKDLQNEMITQQNTLFLNNLIGTKQPIDVN